MKEQNQCDGCQRGLTLEDGLHRGPNMSDMTDCTKDRYVSPQEECPCRKGKDRGDTVGCEKCLPQEGKKCEYKYEFNIDPLAVCGNEMPCSLHSASPEEAQEEPSENASTSSSDWKEQEREAWESLVESNHVGERYSKTIADYWLARIESAREEGLKEKIIIETELWMQKGRAAALSEVKEMLDGLKKKGAWYPGQKTQLIRGFNSGINDALAALQNISKTE